MRRRTGRVRSLSVKRWRRDGTKVRLPRALEPGHGAAAYQAPCQEGSKGKSEGSRERVLVLGEGADGWDPTGALSWAQRG